MTLSPAGGTQRSPATSNESLIALTRLEVGNASL